MNDIEKMYVDFRQEIDTQSAELIIKNLDTRLVTYDDKIVGFLILDGDYVDSFYIVPEYRRKGIGREFIKEQYRKDMCRWHDLRIVKRNGVGLAFWKSVFNMRRITSNFCDLHYEILGLKE